MSAKYFGITWVDPAVGIIGAVLVTRWSIGLLRATSGVLLDRQAPGHLLDRIRQSVETNGACRVVDLHVWSIGSGSYSAIIGVEDRDPRSADEYRHRIPEDLHLDHLTIEVYPPSE